MICCELASGTCANSLQIKACTVQAIRKMSEPDVAALQAHLREHLPTDRSGRIAYPARANAVKGRVPN
jgi:hypothetical protein